MGTSLAKKPAATEIQEFLQANSGRLAQVCGKHLTPEKIIQLAVLCTYRTPKLAECDRPSILASVVQASSLGLDLSPSAGEAYLIPRWNKDAGVNECQFQIGWQGLAKLVRNTGQVPFIQARVVRKRDRFNLAYEDARTTFRHEPALDGDPGPVTHVYAVAKLATGDPMIEVMTRAQVESIRARAKNPDRGPWETDWDEMAKKTVLRRLCKSLPKSADVLAALEAHDADFEMGAFDDGTPARLPAPDNNSGHATGRYASPEQADAYLAKLDAYLEKRQGKWLDRWTDEQTGEIPDGVGETCNRWQADNHLLKWAIATGQLDPASMPDDRGQKHAQIGRFTAIVYHRSRRDRIALTEELARYIDEQERVQEERIRRKNPHLYGEAEAADAPDELQGMADDDPADAD